MNFQRRTLLQAGAAACVASAWPAMAQQYPAKPVKLILPSAPGSTIDANGRYIADQLSRRLKATFVIDNRAGAGGGIGSDIIAKSPADGYSLLFGGTTHFTTRLLPDSGLTYDPVKEFVAIAKVSSGSLALAVPAESPYKTAKDLIAAMKAKPGEVTVGTQGVGSAGHISALLLEQAAGIRLECVSYAGSAPAAVALMRRDIQVTTASLGESLTFAQQQPWRVLGLMAPDRSELARDIPTCKEAGYDIRGGSLRGIGAPSGLPEAVVRRLSAAISNVLRHPDFREASVRTFQPLRFLDSADYVAYLREADAAHRALWRMRPWNS